MPSTYSHFGFGNVGSSVYIQYIYSVVGALK